MVVTNEGMSCHFDVASGPFKCHISTRCFVVAEQEKSLKKQKQELK